MRTPGTFWWIQTLAGISLAGPILVLGTIYLSEGAYIPAVAAFILGVVAIQLPHIILKAFHPKNLLTGLIPSIPYIHDKKNEPSQSDHQDEQENL